MLLPNHLYYLGPGDEPSVDLMDNDEITARAILLNIGPGRSADESLWRADLRGCLPAADADPIQREWQFRIDRGDGHLVHPVVATCFTTALQTVWVQDGELFGYRPAPEVSPSRVDQDRRIRGSLPARPLYINLPRGFDEHPERRYPVIYMQDGQNCFEAFVADSYVGAWQADLAAEFLISQGLMQECIVVGVSHGQERRMLEYLPPYAAWVPPSQRPFVKALTGDPDERTAGQAVAAAARPGRPHAALLQRRRGALPGAQLPCAAGPRAARDLRLVHGRAVRDLRRAGPSGVRPQPRGARPRRFGSLAVATASWMSSNGCAAGRDGTSACGWTAARGARPTAATTVCATR